jgi:uncharacterized protein (DUF427 family)
MGPGNGATGNGPAGSETTGSGGGTGEDAVVATSPSPRGRISIEGCRKRLRAYLGGRVALDTPAPTLVWEVPYYPAYYVPRSDVQARLEPSGRREHSPSRGEATYFDVHLGHRVVRDGAWTFADSPIEALRDLVRFEWEGMDEWLEEDEPVYVHPRDPYKRVDILNSSRRVQVVVDGVEVADSDQPRILFETSLPPRYYLPLHHVRTELLVPSTTTTRCPYKGTATYWHVEVNGQRHPDSVWMYRSPLPESAKIIGLACFYNEHVDLLVDGQPIERPHTHFSSRVAPRPPAGSGS